MRAPRMIQLERCATFSVYGSFWDSLADFFWENETEYRGLSHWGKCWVCIKSVCVFVCVCVLWIPFRSFVFSRTADTNLPIQARESEPYTPWISSGSTFLTTMCWPSSQPLGSRFFWFGCAVFCVHFYFPFHLTLRPTSLLATNVCISKQSSCNSRLSKWCMQIELQMDWPQPVSSKGKKCFLANCFFVSSQDCNDSNYSLSEPLSDDGYVDEKETVRRENERQALIQLEKAQVSAFLQFQVWVIRVLISQSPNR